MVFYNQCVVILPRNIWLHMCIGVINRMQGVLLTVICYIYWKCRCAHAIVHTSKSHTWHHENQRKQWAVATTAPRKIPLMPAIAGRSEEQSPWPDCFYSALLNSIMKFKAQSKQINCSIFTMSVKTKASLFWIVLSRFSCSFWREEDSPTRPRSCNLWAKQRGWASSGRLVTCR